MNGAEIKALREALRLSQEQLAQHLRVSVMTISRWERGLAKPLASLMEKLQQMKTEWESELFPEDIITEEGQFVFSRRSSEASSFAHAAVDWNLDDWVEKRRPDCVLDEAIIKPYGRGRFQITRIRVKRKGT